MREWIWRAKSMFRRKRMEAETKEELQLHFDMEVEAGRRLGLSAEESGRRARLRVGLVFEGVESTREEFGFHWLNGASGDLRHALRTLTRSGAFGTVAVLVLAVSVAISTLIFCLVEGVVLKPLPYSSPQRLVRLYDAGKTEPKFPMSLGHYMDYRANAKSLEAIALYTGRDMELSASEGRPAQLTGLSVTSDYFAVLGKTPLLGRAFINADLRKGVRHVIISHRFWRDRLHSDPTIAGKAIRLDREPWTIIGVAPIGFQHVGGDYRSPLQGETVDIWTPLNLDGPESAIRAYHFSNAIARIREGFSVLQAKQELLRLAALYEQRYPDYGQWSIRVEPLLSEVTGRSGQVIWLLTAAGGLVLLVACGNIAGLCVARAVARRKELSLRHALGANRWQLVRVGLAENLLIGVAGAIAGLLLAAAVLPLLHRLLPEDFPRAHEIALTPLAAVFAVAVAMATVLIAGLLPVRGGEALQSHQRFSSGRDSRKLRTVLVAGELALAGLLCAGTLFLLRSYQEIGARDHGFRPAGVLTFQLSVPSGAYSKPGRITRLYDEIRAKISEIPGVDSVGASTNLPWSGYDENSGFQIVGRIANDRDELNARYQAASPGYSEATGMRLVSGRFFDQSKDASGQPLSVIVNNALASRYFPNENALGAMLKIWGEDRRIVGVVADIRDLPADLDTRPAFWFPLGQREFGRVSFAVHSNRMEPASAASLVADAVHSVDPELALANISTLERHAGSALASRRFALWLFQAFAALALILAAAGIYGLLAYIVQQRRKEFGIRSALGASRENLSGMVLFDGLKMASAGALCCVLLIPVGGLLLQAFLYNVRAFDLLTIFAAPSALLVVALFASLGPARSAIRSDPSLALRED
ncbi:MAG: ABC transporter permease [Bryobacteraceae bacterium]|nr:ABC transporter permease [Bryobacteraceae bacterium]